MRKLLIAVIVFAAAGVAWWGVGRSRAHGAEQASATSTSYSDLISTSAGGAEDSQQTPQSEATVRDEVGTTSNSSALPGATGKRLYGSPFEQSLLTRGKVNDLALKSLEAKNFDAVINELDAQNKGMENPLATNYRRQLEGTLSSFGQNLQLDRLACGTNVCLASIRSAAGSSAFNDWYENVQTAAPAPMGGLAEFPVNLSGGVIEHRILFTTDPRSAGFIVGPPSSLPDGKG